MEKRLIALVDQTSFCAHLAVNSNHSRSGIIATGNTICLIGQTSFRHEKNRRRVVFFMAKSA